MAARALSSLAAAATGLLAPSIALACPYCAGRSKGGIATNIVLGLFVSLPFLLSWVVYRFIRTHDDGALAPPKAHGDSPDVLSLNRSRRPAS